MPGMGSNSKLPKPSDAELSILRVLWEQGACTVREVTEHLTRLRPPRSMGYTTALKIMQIMAVKGLVKRDESERSHRYAAAVGPDRTKNQMVTDLVERLFGGSAAGMVLQALGSGRVSTAELESIRRMIEEMEGRS
jgi:BlaI family transcriptional regulator, penicillinase repressor